MWGATETAHAQQGQFSVPVPVCTHNVRASTRVLNASFSGRRLGVGGERAGCYISRSCDHPPHNSCTCKTVPCQTQLRLARPTRTPHRLLTAGLRGRGEPVSWVHRHGVGEPRLRGATSTTTRLTPCESPRNLARMNERTLHRHWMQYQTSYASPTPNRCIANSSCGRSIDVRRRFTYGAQRHITGASFSCPSMC